jgi:WD40 repeat protein
LQPKVPRDLETICLKCLHKQPNKRYTSAKELAEELHRFLEGEPIRARPIGLAERTLKWARRRPAPAALILTSVLGIVSLFLGGAYFTGELSVERNKAVAEKSQADELRIEADGLRVRAEEGKTAAEKLRERAEKGENDAKQHLEAARQALFSAQLARVAGLYHTDPVEGLRLLRDAQACPPAMRDFAWFFYDRLCHSERATFPSGPRGQRSIAFSPDGKLLAAACADHKVRLWDFASQKLLHQCTGHTEAVSGVVFTRDGKTLISGSDDRTIRFWDVASGRETKAIKGMSGLIQYLALHPAGKWLAAVSYLRNPKPRNGSERLYQGEVTLWDVETQEKKTLVKNYSSGFLCVAFSPDGKLVAASTSHTSHVRLWEVESGKSYGTFRGKNIGWIDTATFSHNGKYLAFGSANHLVHFWDVASKQELTPFSGHVNEVESVAFSPDDKVLISSALDRTVRVWDVDSRRELCTYRNYNKAPVAFTPDGKCLICEKGNNLCQLTLFPQPEYRTLKDHTDGILGLAYAPNGKHIASVGKDKIARLWDPLQGNHISIGNFSEPPGCVAIAGDSQTVFIGAALDSKDKQKAGQIARWDISARGKNSPLLGHSSPVTALAASPAWPLLASGSEGTLKWWDLSQDKELGQLTYEKQPLLSLAFHPKEKLLAGAVGRQLMLWDLGKDPPAVKVFNVATRFVSFTPSGGHLAVVSGNQVLFLDPASGQRVKRIGPTTTAIASLAFTHDERTAAVGLHDRSIQLWDAASNQQRATFNGHLREVTALAFSPDDTMLASGDRDLTNVFWVRGGEIKLWNAQPSRPVEP